jgi:protein O-GlcNAc transferase
MKEIDLQKIIKLFNNNSYREVVIEAHKILKKNKNIQLYGNIALSYLHLGKNHLSKKYLLKIIKIDKNNPNANHNLGLIFSRLGKINKSIYYYNLSLKNGSFFFLTLTELCELLLKKHKINLANKLIETYKNKIPDDLKLFLQTSLFNLKYKNKDEFDTQIRNSEKLIDEFKLYNNDKNNTLNELIKKINFIPPSVFSLTFYLEKPEKTLKKYYKIYDQISNGLNIPKKQTPSIIKFKKIKIAFASSILRKHTITKLFKNWIFKLDKNKFDIYVIDLKSEQDEIYHQIKQYAEEIITTTENLDFNINNIRDKNFDYIIYLDNLISREASLLFNFQLAKKQAVTWGHPVTSGSRYINYFLSSELMENKFSEKKYTEKLIKLSNLSIYYEEPKIKINQSIKKYFDDSLINILNLQSLFKFQPYEDKIYAEILNRNKNINLHFIDSDIPFHKNIFKKRISKFLNDKKLEKNINFLPRCDNNTFYNYIKFSSFIIDCLSWSGGNTHLEALAFNKAIVTCEGKSLKQNHTTGLLKRINQNEMITYNHPDYINKILKLSESKNYIETCEKSISDNKINLFYDKECIASLENALIDNLS